MAVLSERHTVTGLDLPELDITDTASVRSALEVSRPAVVVNCAAYTNVDGAESDAETAWGVNCGGPRVLAECCRGSSVRLIHISTDYVFDGERKPPAGYAESDRPAPGTVYGRGKLAGEEAVRKILSDFVILRTAWLYGAAGRNFLKTVLRLTLRKPGEELRIVNDQCGSPTWSYRLALQVEAMLGRGRGVYHAAGQGSCTWYKLAGEFLTAMRVEHCLVPCSTADYPTPARRPANSVLENRRLESEGLNLMRPWIDDVQEFAALYRDRLLCEANAAAGR